MNELLISSAFFGMFISLGAYQLGVFLRKKTKLPFMNPLLIAIVLVIAFLLVFNIDYEVYNNGAKYISYFLTPATVCLAVPLYEQFSLLKKNAVMILAGIVTGVLSSAGIVLLMCILFSFDHTMYVTLLPKSITTAIGMGVSEELGGYVNVTVVTIIMTGILGNIIAEPVLKLFRITEPVAKGIGIGSAAHAIGTAKAMEIGEVEGAISSLSLAVSGFLTVFAAILFAGGL